MRVLRIVQTIVMTMSDEAVASLAGRKSEELLKLRTIEAVERRIGRITRAEFDLALEILCTTFEGYLRRRTPTEH